MKRSQTIDPRRRAFLNRAGSLLLGGTALALLPGVAPGTGALRKNREEEEMKLPQPQWEGEVPLERTIKERRTIRTFRSSGMSREKWSQLMAAAQGITQDGGVKRAAPSAGALYPMDLYSVVGDAGVDGVAAGVYRYVPGSHGVTLISEGDRREPLARAALSQMWMAKAPVNFVITAEYRRVTAKYGKRGVRYAMIEAGHIGQNIFLQAAALKMGAGIVGAFADGEVTHVLGAPEKHEPLLIMPVGYQR